jgi:transposase
MFIAVCSERSNSDVAYTGHRHGKLFIGRPCKERADDLLNPLSPELNPICYLLALLTHDFLHVSRIRVKSLTLRVLMSYIYIYIYM